MEQEDQNKQPNRTQGDYLNMTHSPLLNHLRTETKKTKGETPAFKIGEFLTKRLWTWFYYYAGSRFGPDYPFKTYIGTDNGIYNIKPTEPGVDTVCIAVTADWGTDTKESYEIAAGMRAHNPDYTIHLGDTYFVGAPHEIELNFTKPGSPWVRGSKGSFALLGNHEMYARGIAFFEKLLPTLGIKDSLGNSTGQKASFFCLENDHWRILALDTGYYSIGKIPFVELLPGCGPDSHFDKKLVEWLYNSLKLDDKNDKRGLLLLTHNQYITSFYDEDEYLVPAEQLAKLIGKDRPVVWLWGHEHKFSVYEKVQIGNGITAYGRCIGHGGMPVEISSSGFKRNPKSTGYSKLIMVDDRQQPGTDSCPLGYNGYSVLSLKNDQLEIGYYDVNGKLFTELWTADTQTGEIKGSIDVPDVTLLKTVDNKVWNDAVR